MFELRPAPPGRGWFSLRAAVCIGVPILAGWWLGDISAGLMASIGGFTALYGGGRPYLNRARQLAFVAAAFALSVGLGLWVAETAWAAIVTVALIAMLATWLSNSLQVGPPGAYLFTLACAAGTSMRAEHLDPIQATWLVFAGGAFAWFFHMGGALLSWRAPERSAVKNAGKAVIAYIEAIGTPQEDGARHRAAFALHNAWSVLINQQPISVGADSTLSRLRTLNRELHLRFADAMRAASERKGVSAELTMEVRKLIEQIRDPRELPGFPMDSVPLGHPGPFASMAEALLPGSNTLRVIIRVGVAAVVVSILSSALHLERAYWAVAAAVLMLHQGFDWIRTLQRSIERLLGTWVGLLLAGLILSLHPQGVWLALIVMALQFTIEMLVIRNYAIAAIFITGAALTIATGGQRLDDPGEYLLARGVDTLAGCLVALLIYRLIPPRAATVRIPEHLAQTLRAIAGTVSYLAQGTVTTTEARVARQVLQRSSFALMHAYEDSIANSRGARRIAERHWPVIAATERLVYRTLSSCWALERLGGDSAREAASSMFGAEGVQRLNVALESLIQALQHSAAPPALPVLPKILEEEVQNVHRLLSETTEESITRAT